MSKKILILDDDPDILEILSLVLIEGGYEVRILSCGNTVFDEIKDFQPDLVLMDVMLAGMDGRAIWKEIKENHLTYFLPVILISGTHDLAKSLLLPGAPNDFVAKPFDIDYLLERIEKHLAAWCFYANGVNGYFLTTIFHFLKIIAWIMPSPRILYFRQITWLNRFEYPVIQMVALQNILIFIDYLFDRIEKQFNSLSKMQLISYTQRPQPNTQKKYKPAAYNYL